MRHQPSQKPRTTPLNPGDVILHTWRVTKARPWLLLWIDPDTDTGCFIALSRQAGYPGAIETGDPIYAHAASWVCLQPLVTVAWAPIGFIDAERRHRIAEALHRNLSLLPEHEETGT